MEFPNCEGKSTVGGQVGIAKEGELRLKLLGFCKRLAVEEAEPDQLPGGFDQNLVVPRLQNIKPEDLHLLVNLLGLSFFGLLALHRLGLI